LKSRAGLWSRDQQPSLVAQPPVRVSQRLAEPLAFSREIEEHDRIQTELGIGLSREDRMTGCGKILDEGTEGTGLRSGEQHAAGLGGEEGQQ
jgi:hypothetical protein